MPRGGKREGAGRPAKPVDEHLAEGTYRPDRHDPDRRRPQEIEERLAELRGPMSMRKQMYGQTGPWENAPGGGEAAWVRWDRKHGYRWRLAHAIPHQLDREQLAEEHGITLDELHGERLLEILEAVDRSEKIPDPPGWRDVN